MSGGQQVSAWPKHSWLRLQAKGLFRYLYIWRSPYIQRLFVQHQGAASPKAACRFCGSSIIAIAIIGCLNGGTKGAARSLRWLAAGSILHQPAGVGLSAYRSRYAESRSFLPMDTIGAHRYAAQSGRVYRAAFKRPFTF